MARPAKPHHNYANGQMQEIPKAYFRKECSFYGTVGIGRLSFEPTVEEMRRDGKERRDGCAEPDWIDVLVNRADFVRLLGMAV